MLFDADATLASVTGSSGIGWSALTGLAGRVVGDAMRSGRPVRLRHTRATTRLSPPLADGFVTCGGQQRTRTSLDALLIVSELAANAVQHARTPFTVEVQRDGDLAMVIVRDSSAMMPVMRNNDRLPEADVVSPSWTSLPTAGEASQPLAANRCGPPSRPLEVLRQSDVPAPPSSNTSPSAWRPAAGDFLSSQWLPPRPRRGPVVTHSRA